MSTSPHLDKIDHMLLEENHIEGGEEGNTTALIYKMNIVNETTEHEGKAQDEGKDLGSGLLTTAETSVEVKKEDEQDEEPANQVNNTAAKGAQGTPKKRPAVSEIALPAKKRSPTKNNKKGKGVLNGEKFTIHDDSAESQTAITTRSAAKEEADIVEAANTLLAAAIEPALSKIPVTPTKTKAGKGEIAAVTTNLGTTLHHLPKTPEQVNEGAAALTSMSSDKSSSPKSSGSQSTGKTSPTKSNKASPSKPKAYNNEFTVHNTPRKRSAPKSSMAPQSAIPNSWEEAGEADRMLVKMKEDGKSWGDIRKMWAHITGHNIGPSTLPNRYSRLKVNFMGLKEGDDALLVYAKLEVEKSLESSKWDMISSTLHKRSGNKYPSAFLVKKFKELEATGFEGVDFSLGATIGAINLGETAGVEGVAKLAKAAVEGDKGGEAVQSSEGSQGGGGAVMDGKAGLADDIGAGVANVGGEAQGDGGEMDTAADTDTAG